MAESVPQKRVLPPRERRESKRLRGSPATTPGSTPAPKNQPSTPSASTPTPADSRSKQRPSRKRSSLAPPPTPSNASASPAPEEEAWPTKLSASGPLPSSKTKQAADLSKKDFQSVADSAILAASLHRSRMQWLAEGVFKKYWVKPVKRKGVVDVPPDNPDVKSMQKMGNGTITIEPHKFDVTFFVVRDSQAPLAYSRPPNPPLPKQQAPPYSSPIPTTPHRYPPVTPANAHQATPTPAPALGPASTPISQPLPPPTSIKPEPMPPPPRQVPAPAPRPPAPKTSTDPVIQMLAARAASDPRLKDLMKVVATSKASQDQLREFQLVPPHTPYNAAPAPVPAPAPSTMPPPPHYPPYPPQPRAEALIKHIVVEFHGEGSSPDRWLFPEYAVLDIRYGGLEMTVSFFVERKGADIIKQLAGGSEEDREVLASKWKADAEYYQPVTMQVRANQHKTIETIARGAKTLPAVQEYMKQVMQEKIRAPTEYLVHQLPREKRVVDFVDSGVDMCSADEEDVLEDFYGN
ncbi:hypothetical protein DV735_g4649, partial [Chaetothyriales sp. CBS 134920]